MKYEYGFIGCGNMGGAIVKAVSKQVDGARICICDRDAAKCDALSAECGVSVEKINDLARDSRHIVLGVKPQMMAAALEEIAPILKAREDRFVLVTIAAGLTMATIQEMAGGNYPIIRLMPNIPASVGKGMILYCSAKTHLDEMVTFLHIMKEAGRFDELAENLIDAGSAVTGCGPAFAYMFIEALADGGVMTGLPRAQAMTYAAQTVLGSAKLVLETGKHPGERLSPRGGGRQDRRAHLVAVCLPRRLRRQHAFRRRARLLRHPRARRDP